MDKDRAGIGAEQTVTRVPESELAVFTWQATNGVSGLITFGEGGTPHIDLTLPKGRDESNFFDTQAIIDQFHGIYYNNPRKTWCNTFWLGIPVQKCPLD